MDAYGNDRRGIKVINGVDVNKLQATIDAINKDRSASFTFAP